MIAKSLEDIDILPLSLAPEIDHTYPSRLSEEHLAPGQTSKKTLRNVPFDTKPQVPAHPRPTCMGFRAGTLQAARSSW